VSGIEITEEKLEALRGSLPSFVSGKRLFHILAVEKMAVRLGELYLPGKEMQLRAAALLHDVTKEYSYEKQLTTAAAHGIELSAIELAAPKTLHAITAAALIPELYPELADDEVVSGVRWHTTGRAGMTVFEKLIYFADYIDDSRKFPECVRLRESFWGADPASMNTEEREEHLMDLLIDSYDVTVRGLLEDGAPVHPATSDARNELILQKKENEKAKNRG